MNNRNAESAHSIHFSIKLCSRSLSVVHPFISNRPYHLSPSLLIGRHYHYVTIRMLFLSALNILISDSVRLTAWISQASIRTQIFWVNVWVNNNHCPRFTVKKNYKKLVVLKSKYMCFIFRMKIETQMTIAGNWPFNKEILYFENPGPWEGYLCTFVFHSVSL